MRLQRLLGVVKASHLAREGWVKVEPRMVLSKAVGEVWEISVERGGGRAVGVLVCRKRLWGLSKLR